MRYFTKKMEQSIAPAGTFTFRDDLHETPFENLTVSIVPALGAVYHYSIEYGGVPQVAADDDPLVLYNDSRIFAPNTPSESRYKKQTKVVDRGVDYLPVVDEPINFIGGTPDVQNLVFSGLLSATYPTVRVCMFAGGLGQIYREDHDFRLNYTTGQITRLLGGAIPALGAVFVSYVRAALAAEKTVTHVFNIPKTMAELDSLMPLSVVIINNDVVSRSFTVSFVSLARV